MNIVQQINEIAAASGLSTDEQTKVEAEVRRLSEEGAR